MRDLICTDGYKKSVITWNENHNYRSYMGNQYLPMLIAIMMLIRTSVLEVLEEQSECLL